MNTLTKVASIQKCQHSVYLASPEERRTERARYCSFCTPSVDAASSSLHYLLRKSKGGE